jgi:hypothetical protein
MKPILKPPRRKKHSSLFCWAIGFAIAFIVLITGVAVAAVVMVQMARAVLAQVAASVLAGIALVAQMAMILAAILFTIALMMLLQTPPLLAPFGPAARLLGGLVRALIALNAG